MLGALRDHFRLGQVANRVERIVFQDGTTFTDSDLASRMLLATEGDDVIVGGSQADTLNGLGGHDLIYGLTGDDVIAGNAGNDVLYGGSLFSDSQCYHAEAACNAR